MAFANPTTITINAVAKALDRYSGPMNGASEYSLRSATDEFRLKIRNTKYTDKKRNVEIHRHNVEFVQTVFPVSPATLSTIRKVYFVIEDQDGDTASDVVNMVAGLFGLFTASSNARMTDLVADLS